MVLVDHNSNINRIVDKIKSYEPIYDKGVTDGKLRSVTFGNPNNNDIIAVKLKPALFVTTSTSIQNTSYSFGHLIDNNQDQITVSYELTIIAKSKMKTEYAQKQLYELIKNLREMILEDPQFANGEEPIFQRSVINSVNWNTSTRGQLITSVTLSLLATIGNMFTITFPGIGTVILLSKPDNPEGIIYSEDRTQGKKNRVLSENGDFGKFNIQYESSVELDQQFRDKFGIEENVVLKTPTGLRIIRIKYIDINPTAQFDQIERSILHMEIVAE